MVGAAAAAEHVQPRQRAHQRAVVVAELLRVAVVEHRRGVELGVAHLRGVGAQAADAVPPGPRLDAVAEVRGMGAVHHVVGGIALGRGVAGLDRRLEARAGAQAAVGLQRERDHHRHARRLGRAGDADRLLDVGHGDRGDEIGAGLGEHPHLAGMIGLRLLGGHVAVGRVAVAARAEAAADHHRRARRLLGVADRVQEVDRGGVGRVERLGRIAERRAPVRVRPPGGALQHQAAAVALGERNVGREVARELRPARLGAQQVEGGEVRQLLALVEDQRGLDAAVGQEQLVPSCGRAWRYLACMSALPVVGSADTAEIPLARKGALRYSE